MEGIAGLHGWQWIFILEGLATLVAGVASYWVVQDFPDNATFLNEKERAMVIWRLEHDSSHAQVKESFSWPAVWNAVSDWKMWAGMIIYMGADMALYAFSLFLPSKYSAYQPHDSRS